MLKDHTDEHGRNNHKFRTLTFNQKRKLRRWATSFRRSDPRFQILHFFNNVAQQDASGEALERSGVKSLSYFSAKAKQDPLVAAHISAMSRSEADISLDTHQHHGHQDNHASCFSVWRPTSREALRYMMLGSAVGKGLDIKGKSAKMGRLSAFVPFLQIHKDEHVPKIRIYQPSEAKAATIRVFFSTRQRQHYAKQVMEQVQLDILPNKSNNGNINIIEEINDYAATDCFGLSIPEAVLWEGFVARSPTGISRAPGTPGEPYATGRPSVPQFQDMNLDALRKAPLPGTPRLVLWQFDDDQADVDDPCNPLTLLMAYEEKEFSRVLPVVSDLDCFLIGTRGVNYEKPLPKDQQKVLQWSVDRIQGILEKQQTQPAATSWTSRWLDVLKVSASQYGFHPKIPALGFSDPKTKLIMKHAISRLSDSGAVRHGAECFNFYFPQDLDNEFLVISDFLPGQELSWTYVDTYGLIGILSEKLDHGYTFPLNPKWVLCDDPSWKILWDKLLTSHEANQRGALRAWYPQTIRHQIEDICERHPNGFIPEGPPESATVAPSSAAAAVTTDDDQADQRTVFGDMDAEMAMELANYELIQYLMDLDKAEKQKEKDRRAGLSTAKEKKSITPDNVPGVTYTMEAVPMGKRKSEAKKQASKPGAFSSYDDVAAAKSSWRLGPSAGSAAAISDPTRRRSTTRASLVITKPREDPLQDPTVQNVHSLVGGIRSMPDVLVDVLATGMSDNMANELMQLYCLEQFCELLSSDNDADVTSAKALLVAQGVDVDTILVMKTYSHSLAVQEQGIRLLCLLSNETGGGNCINATSRIVAVSRVVDAMKWFLTELKGDTKEAHRGAKFARYAVGTVRNLVMDKKASKIFKSLEGGQATVSSVMGLYPQAPDIQLDSVSILASSSSLPEDNLSAREILTRVAMALAEYYDTCQQPGRSIASGCCRALSKWTEEEERSVPLLQQYLSERGNNLVECLRFVAEHAVESKCRKKSATLLKRLTGEDSTQKTSVSRKNNSGGNQHPSHSKRDSVMPLDEVLSYLERLDHLSEDAVFLCLISLCHHIDEHRASGRATANGNHSISEKILRRNGIVMICSAMRTFGNAVAVQERGCFVLSCMSQLHPKRVLSAGCVCDTLLFSVECHKSVNDLQRSALSALLNLSVDFDCWFQVQESGKMDFLQELIYNTEDEEAADLGIQILSNFSKFGM